jgi:hypothetical protein
MGSGRGRYDDWGDALAEGNAPTRSRAVAYGHPGDREGAEPYDAEDAEDGDDGYDDDVTETVDAGGGSIVTPLRVLALVGLLAGAGLVAYGIFVDRSATQVPIFVAGLVVAGVTFIVMALASARAAVAAARQRRSGRSFFLALFGGGCAMAAAGCLAAAAVLALVYGSTPSA